MRSTAALAWLCCLCIGIFTDWPDTWKFVPNNTMGIFMTTEKSKSEHLQAIDLVWSIASLVWFIMAIALNAEFGSYQDFVVAVNQYEKDNFVNFYHALFKKIIYLKKGSSLHNFHWIRIYVKNDSARGSSVHNTTTRRARFF